MYTYFIKFIISSFYLFLVQFFWKLHFTHAPIRREELMGKNVPVSVLWMYLEKSQIFNTTVLTILEMCLNYILCESPLYLQLEFLTQNELCLSYVTHSRPSGFSTFIIDELGLRLLLMCPHFFREVCLVDLVW